MKHYTSKSTCCKVGFKHFPHILVWALAGLRPRKRSLATSFCTCKTMSEVLRLVWGSPVQGGHWHTGTSTVQATTLVKRLAQEDRLAWLHLLRLTERSLRGHDTSDYDCAIGGHRDDAARLFWEVNSCGARRNGHKREHGKCQFVIGKKVFLLWVVKYCETWPREVVISSALETFRNCLDMSLRMWI